MPRRDPAQAVQMLDLLREFFDSGRRWLRWDYHDEDGSRCLLSAMAHMRAVMNVHGDGTGYYLRKADPHDVTIIDLNDSSKSYDEIRTLIDRAREIAQADLEAKSTRTTARPPARNLGKAIRATRQRPRHPFSTGLPPAIGDDADQDIVVFPRQ